MPTDYLDGATFGVELECYLPESQTMASCAAAISQRLGSPCMVETYNHQTRGHWKIVTDGSLGDSIRGIEIVSPILRGEEGLRAIERVADALTDFGCTVSKKCGYHVHVGARSESLGFFKNLIKLYGMFEPVIDSMMPNSRRASNNTFCRSMTSAAPAAIDRAASLGDLIRAHHSGSNGRGEARYYKLNMSAHARHGTVEFRQHSATLSPTKARNWTVLCLKLVAAAKRNDLPINAAAPTNGSVNQARRGSKAHQIGQMMMRPEGATAREVCAAMNWPSVSMPQQARLCGLQYTTQRTGREVRYFAVMTASAVTAPQVEITIAGFATLIGATDAEREYMAQRTNDLRGPIAWAA